MLIFILILGIVAGWKKKVFFNSSFMFIFILMLYFVLYLLLRFIFIQGNLRNSEGGGDFWSQNFREFARGKCIKSFQFRNWFRLSVYYVSMCLYTEVGSILYTCIYYSIFNIHLYFVYCIFYCILKVYVYCF